MTTISLAVGLLRIDAGTQSRVSINQEVVEDYAELLAVSDGEWPFPPLEVFHDGTDENYMVADGFHRFLAAQSSRGSIPCRVHTGTAKQARIFSMTANDQHGLRMTRADKRACVEWLLDNGGKMTKTAIAEDAGVSRRFVHIVVADREEPKSAHNAHFSGSGPSQQAKQAKSAKKSAAKEPPPDEPSDEERAAEISGKTGRELEVWTAQQVLKQWSDTVGRWMAGRPAGIDAYREQFPGPLGDKVIDAAKVLYNAMVAWKKGIK